MNLHAHPDCDGGHKMRTPVPGRLARRGSGFAAALLLAGALVLSAVSVGMAQVTGAVDGSGPNKGFDGSGPNKGGDLPLPNQVGNDSLQQAIDTVDIDQVWDAYANYLDSGQAENLTGLFTPTGGYVLLYNDRATGKLVPMGFSPNRAANGQGGTPGGGCTALGHTAIVHFLTAIGLGNNNPRAQLSHHEVTSKWITVDGNNATMHAYWNSLAGPDTGQTTTTVSDGGQYDNTFVRTPSGWKADQNRVIFDSNNPNFPCAN
jgi:SnoaL-like domain